MSFVSPDQYMGTLTLHNKGRVFLSDDVDRWLTKATFALHEAVLTHEIAALSRKLPLPQRDPADRFLAATALLLLTLVTADPNLLGLGQISALANR
jgi:PIN domain nuclease of toxin-antitoxin system